MSRVGGFLFYGGVDAFAVASGSKQTLEAEISEMDGNRLLNTNVDDLVSHFVEKYRLEAPVLDEAGMTVDQREKSRDVSGDPARRFGFIDTGGPVYAKGTEFIVEVPFSGSGSLFEVRPSTYGSSPPRGEVQGDMVTFRHWTDTPDSAQIREQIDIWLREVKQYLRWLDGSFLEFNRDLPRLVREAITQRRSKLLAAQNTVADLGIPLKRRAGMTETYSAPTVRRKIAPKMPPATIGPYKAEPILEEAEYQHILDILDGMVKVMERSPKAFHTIDEEALRTHFLVQLNGHYDGQATGETFNYQGKTDILIRSGDRNVFIAECKFWNGPAKLTEAIDQLLGYLSWRDSKAAILLFNRNKDFSKVVSAIPETVRLHPNFQREEGTRGQTAFRYALRHKDDAAKILHLTVMAFDIPQSALSG